MSRTVISRVIQQRKHADEGDIAQISRDGLDTFHLVGVQPEVFVFPLVLVAVAPVAVPTTPAPIVPAAETPAIGVALITQLTVDAFIALSVTATPSAGPTPLTPTPETPTIGVVIFTSVT